PPGAAGASRSSWPEAANPAWSAGTTAGATAGQAWTDWRRAGEGAPSGNSWQESWPDDPEPADGDQGVGLAVPGWISGPVARRVVPILLGWPPLGFVLAALLGELTGCGRFSAGCSDAAGVLPWLVQPLGIGLLLELHFLANAAAMRTIGGCVAGN